jgi:TonB family protein
VSGLLQNLQSLIFYPNLDAAVADLPPEYRPLLPMKAPDGNKPKQDRKACDCSSPSVAVCGLPYADMGMAGMKPPSVVSSVEPEFSEEARQKKTNGNVQVGLIISAAGTPDYLWVAKPVGMGLDANAMKSVAQYKFKPATCHDRPVPIPMYIDVNFQIF